MLLWVLSLAALVAGDVEVMLEGLGKLRGKAGVARNNHKYHQFLGIPYAEPPTGDRRGECDKRLMSVSNQFLISGSEIQCQCHHGRRRE